MKTLTRREEHILLAIYHMNDKAYLVNIREKIKEMTGKTLDVGTINKPLKRLAEGGYLDAELGAPSPVRNGKAIKYYQLSPKGYQALNAVKTMNERIWLNVVIPRELI